MTDTFSHEIARQYESLQRECDELRARIEQLEAELDQHAQLARKRATHRQDLAALWQERNGSSKHPDDETLLTWAHDRIRKCENAIRVKGYRWEDELRIQAISYRAKLKKAQARIEQLEAERIELD